MKKLRFKKGKPHLYLFIRVDPLNIEFLNIAKSFSNYSSSSCVLGKFKNCEKIAIINLQAQGKQMP